MIGPTFEIEFIDAPHPRLVVHGEVDIKSAPDLESALAGIDRDQVVVDLSDVSFIDSSGLRVLVMARNQIQDRGGSLVLVATDDAAVVRTMRLAGLSSQFQVVTDADALPE